MMWIIAAVLLLLLLFSIQHWNVEFEIKMPKPGRKSAPSPVAPPPVESEYAWTMRMALKDAYREMTYGRFLWTCPYCLRSFRRGEPSEHKPGCPLSNVAPGNLHPMQSPRVSRIFRRMG